MAAQQQFVIQRAVKAKKKARIAIDGPAGSGKTMTALELAMGLAEGGRIGVIDTEKSSADLYADRYNFDTIKLENFNPLNYIGALEAFAEAGYPVVIVDSWSHAWDGEGGALEMVDAAAARTKGNSYAGWREVTPVHNRMVGAILSYPGHVIVTMRSKMEYVLEKDEKTGKSSPRKVGMAPVQRSGVEYEFDIVVDMDLEHNFIVSKTRLPVLDGKMIKCPTRKVGKGILDDLNSGAEAPTTEAPTSQPMPPAESAATPTPEPAPPAPAWQWKPETREKAKAKLLKLGISEAKAEERLAAVTSQAAMESLAKELNAAPAPEAPPPATPAAASPGAQKAPDSTEVDLPPTSDEKPATEASTTAPPSPAPPAADEPDIEDPFAETKGATAGQSLFGGSSDIGVFLADADAMIKSGNTPGNLLLAIQNSEVLRALINGDFGYGRGVQEELLTQLGRGGWDDLRPEERLTLYWMAQERKEGET